MRIIFLGTTEFAQKILAQLVTSQAHEVVLVITPNDKKYNRKKQLIINPVAKYCLDNNISLIQTPDVNLIADKLKLHLPCNILTCAFGQFLRHPILDNFVVYNIHPSLLPILRGGAPINWSIIKNHQETGVTLMRTNIDMDAGDIIFQNKIKIDLNEDYYSLENKLITNINENLNGQLSQIDAKTVNFLPQKHKNATFGLNIQPNDLWINWNDLAVNIYKKILGLNNIGAKAILNSVEWTIWNAEFEIINNFKEEPGKIISLTKNKLAISCIDGLILLKSFTLANKKRSNTIDFFNGNKTIKQGDKFFVKAEIFESNNKNIEQSAKKSSYLDFPLLKIAKKNIQNSNQAINKFLNQTFTPLTNRSLINQIVFMGMMVCVFFCTTFFIKIPIGKGAYLSFSDILLLYLVVVYKRFPIYIIIILSYGMADFLNGSLFYVPATICIRLMMIVFIRMIIKSRELANYWKCLVVCVISQLFMLFIYWLWDYFVLYPLAPTASFTNLMFNFIQAGIVIIIGPLFTSYLVKSQFTKYLISKIPA